MSFYNINIDSIIEKMLPTQKRDVWHIDWLLSAIKGVKTVYDDFLIYRDATLLTLSYNSQKLLFNKAINDSCDSTLKRIFIDNAADDLEDSYCYDLTEGQDDAYAYKLTEETFLGRYTYQLIEYNFPIDFTVWIPIILTTSTDKVKTIVNFYKLAGKRYKISYF